MDDLKDLEYFLRLCKLNQLNNYKFILKILILNVEELTYSVSSECNWMVSVKTLCFWLILSPLE